MKHKNSLVRTKTIHKAENGNYYETELMTYERFMLRSEYRFPNTEFKKYTYKWNDLRYLVDYPYFYLSKSLSKDFENDLNLNNTKSIIIRVLLFLIASIISAGISNNKHGKLATPKSQLFF